MTAHCGRQRNRAEEGQCERVGKGGGYKIPKTLAPTTGAALNGRTGLFPTASTVHYVLPLLEWHYHSIS